MSSACHLDTALNVEIGVECLIFVIVISFNSGWVLQFVAHSRYCKGALALKRSFLVLCTTFRSDFHVGWKNQNKHSTLNSSFNALSKWHEPNIRICHFLPNLENHKAFLLVVKTTVCLFSTFYATVILAGYCQKVDCHKWYFDITGGIYFTCFPFSVCLATVQRLPHNFMMTADNCMIHSWKMT
jgi:hypothetical protein